MTSVRHPSLDAESPDSSDVDGSSPPGLESFAKLLHRGSELLRDGSPAKAKEYLERALRLLPENTTARNLLALSFFQIGHLESALSIYETLRTERPESIAAKVNLAVVLLKLGRAAAAQPLLEDVVRASPDHRRAWGYLAVAFEQLGRIADAEGAFLSGHYASAAKQLRDRHELHSSSPVADVSTQTSSTMMPPFRRRTLPPDPWMTSANASVAQLAYSGPSRFTATMRPPDLLDALPKLTETPIASRTSSDLADDVEEIPFERTVASPSTIAPLSMGPAPKAAHPVLPLLDAALSSLLVVPHEATVVAHPSGLVIVGLVDGAAPQEAGFAVRIDTVTAFAGPLRREPLPRRPPPAPEPFRTTASPFVLVSGTGQLVLSPPRGMRLLPLEMNADVAFIREDLVVAFDQALLYDLGRMRRPSGSSLSLVRFRGDGVIVLGLERPFLAFDVHGSEVVTLRSDTLIGWIGLLVPEPAATEDEVDDPHELLTFTGEGTVLFRAPIDS